MSASYLIDTCVLSNVVKRDRETRKPLYPALAACFEAVVAAQGLFLAVVTEFELRRGLRKATLENPNTGSRQRAEIARILSGASILALDHTADGWPFATEIWAQGEAHRPAVRFPELEDLLIVATAHAWGRVLLTTDEKLCQRLGLLGHGALVELAPLM